MKKLILTVMACSIVMATAAFAEGEGNSSRPPTGPSYPVTPIPGATGDNRGNDAYPNPTNSMGKCDNGLVPAYYLAPGATRYTVICIQEPYTPNN